MFDQEMFDPFEAEYVPTTHELQMRALNKKWNDYFTVRPGPLDGAMARDLAAEFAEFGHSPELVARYEQLTAKRAAITATYARLNKGGHSI